MHQHQNLTPAMTQHAARSVFSPPCEAARLEEELSKRKKGLDTAIFLDAPKELTIDGFAGRCLATASAVLLGSVF